jgi:signal transduction histidine kinase/ActR/RegA family two-component response regulator
MAEAEPARVTTDESVLRKAAEVDFSDTLPGAAFWAGTVLACFAVGHVLLGSQIAHALPFAAAASVEWSLALWLRSSIPKPDVYVSTCMIGLLALVAVLWHLILEPAPNNTAPLVFANLMAAILVPSRAMTYSFYALTSIVFTGIVLFSGQPLPEWGQYAVSFIGSLIGGVGVLEIRRASIFRLLDLRWEAARNRETAESELKLRSEAEAVLRASHEQLQLTATTLHELSRAPSLAAGDSDAFIPLALEKTEAVMRTGRVSLWIYNEAGQRVRRHDRIHHGVYQAGSVDAPVFNLGLQKDSRTITVQDLGEAPPKDPLGQYLVEHGIQAVLAAPIRIAGVLRGLLVCENLEGVRHWTGEECNFVASVGDLIATVLLAEHNLELESKMAEAQRLESLGVMAGGVAHDFNNLLTAILGYAEVAAARTPPGEASDAISEIETAGKRAAELANQMLAYSGRTRLALQVTSISRLAREIAAVVPMGEGVGFDLAIDDAVDTGVEGDPTQIRQVILNLLTNAKDAIQPTGQIRIRTGCSESAGDAAVVATLHGTLEEGRYAWVEVSDDGVGMDPDTMAHMFDPFFTTKFRGRGLGLAAVLGIVRAHRGAIEVESTQEDGTRVRLWIPTTQNRPSPAKTAPDPLEAEPVNGLRALVVDDEKTVRRLVNALLSGAGFRVEETSGVQETLKLATGREEPWDVAVIDLTMPDGDGADLAQQLSVRWPELPVLLMSGYDEMAVARGKLSEQRTRFLHKPFSGRVLVDEVRSLLTKQRDENTVLVDQGAASAPPEIQRR